MKKSRKNLLNVYVDMDGVIANFDMEINALERFKTEKGFFRKLSLMNADGMRELIKADGKEINLFILSASPNKQADKDKKAWLNFFYPQIKKRNIIIMRCGQNKAKFRKTEKGVLLDDYGKNCREWEADGNMAIKVETTLMACVKKLGLGK